MVQHASGNTSSPISSTFDASPTSTTQYWVRITDSANDTADSNAATITVNATLSIGTQPASANIDIGQFDLLSVIAANGTTPYTYQWYIGVSGIETSPIEGATNSTLSVTPTSTAMYWVLITDSANGTAGPAQFDSNTATITVHAALSIGTQPDSANIDLGQFDLLSVTAPTARRLTPTSGLSAPAATPPNPCCQALTSTVSTPRRPATINVLGTLHGFG